ncbi:MAG: type II toxin-antitoxin system MqsA family antitoxin [Gammaproteobacteria bacterium]
MTNKEYCPFCGEKAYYHQTKPFTLRYKKHVITVQQPGHWCNSCHESVIGDDDRKATQKELQSFRSKVDGLLTPDAIKSIRLKLHIRQDQAGELFGGGMNAFSRYEQGLTPIPRSTSQLLRILEKHPDLLIELNSGDRQSIV